MGDEDLLKLFGVENGCLPEVTAEKMMLLRDVMIRLYCSNHKAL